MRANAVFWVMLMSVAACGKGDKGTGAGGSGSGSAGSGGSAAALAPIALPALGVDEPKRMNFIYEVGAPAYDKAVAAYKAKVRDWAGVRSNCEAAVAKDAGHLDAHRLLADALAQDGDYAGTARELALVLGADYFKYGASIAKDDDLKTFVSSPQGKAIAQLATTIETEYGKRIAAGLWVLARRSPFKLPAATGTQPVTTRGELYAYDREARRYLRLTHTEHQLAGVLRSPSGGEVALIGYDKATRPADPTAAPLIARAWVQPVDPKTWQPSGARVVLPAGRELSVGYGTGDDLLVATAPATSRWVIGDPQVQSVDRTTGKITKIAGAPPPRRIALTFDEGGLVQAATGIDAAWAGTPPTAPSLKTAAGATIAVPESGQAAQASVAIAPDSAHLAFATAVDPCAKDVAPSLYVADAKTGALKHVLTAQSRFATRWLDPTTLAYEDGDGAIRLWDATTGREVLRLDDKAGLALDVLSTSSAPICKQAPPAIDAAGSDEPLPTEETGSGSGSGSAK